MKYAFQLAANKSHICFIGTPTKELSYSVKEWEQMNRKEFKLTGSWMSYSNPFPGREWIETERCFADGTLKFDEELFFAKYPISTKRITRIEVKSHICHAGNARDSNLRQALVDRFAKHDLKRGKGTKKNPDWFYGFADDIWQAYALGVTALDTDEPAYKEVEDDVMRCSQCGKLVCSTTVICPRCGRYLN